MEKHSIDGLEIYYSRIYRKIRIPRLEFENGELLLVLPLGYTEERILIEQHKRWIKNRYKSFGEIDELSRSIEDREGIDIGLFRNFAEAKIKEFSEELKVVTGNVVLRKLKSRWGSCSNKGEITVNLLLRFLPENLVEYILFHEVAHMVERRHNKRFYDIISRKFGSRKDIEKQLSAYWYRLFYKHAKER